MFTENLAFYLKTECKNRKLTNKELAKASGLSESFIRKLKSNSCDSITLETCDKLAKAFEISLRVFLEEIGAIDILGLDYVTNNDAEQIYNLFYSLSEKYSLNLSSLNRNEKIELANHLVQTIRLTYSR